VKTVDRYGSTLAEVFSLAKLFRPVTIIQAIVEDGQAKGLYKTQAKAEQRGKELGCNGTHLNNGLWMPCGHEAQLHKELRQE